MALRIVHGWKGLAPAERGAALALGNFDGVHLGHQQVIALAAKAAQSLKAPLGVLSFEPHPRRYFQPDVAPFQLMSLPQQAEVLEGLGVDVFYVLPFDVVMAGLTDEAFAHEVLAEGLGVRHVAAGFDVTFGKGRSGSPAHLVDYGAKFGFGVSVAEQLLGPHGEKCSSTAVREALAAGQPELAAQLLGRPFAIRAVVVHGDKIGRTLGFPTANMEFGDYVRPRPGIYAARTRLADGREIAGVAYIGMRPTVNGVDERLEVNLFDFDEDLYGQTLETDLVRFIRGDEHFDSLEAMKAQIARDCQTARDLLLPAF